MANRRIVQIMATVENRWNYGTLVALCDDGTAWRLVEGGDILTREWMALPPIPQHDLNWPWLPAEMLVAKASCQELNPEER